MGSQGRKFLYADNEDSDHTAQADLSLCAHVRRQVSHIALPYTADEKKTLCTLLLRKSHVYVNHAHNLHLKGSFGDFSYLHVLRIKRISSFESLREKMHLTTYAEHNEDSPAGT